MMEVKQRLSINEEKLEKTTEDLATALTELSFSKTNLKEFGAANDILMAKVEELEEKITVLKNPRSSILVVTNNNYVSDHPCSTHPPTLKEEVWIS